MNFGLLQPLLFFRNSLQAFYNLNEARQIQSTTTNKQLHAADR